METRLPAATLIQFSSTACDTCVGFVHDLVEKLDPSILLRMPLEHVRLFVVCEEGWVVRVS